MSFTAKALGPGDILEDRFEILDTIGEGGYGIVFKAQQTSTEQPVAIKVLQSNKLADPKKRRSEVGRFEREMKVIARLKHPNIVRLIDSGHLEDGALFTVLEFVEGTSLAEVLEDEGALEPREAKRLMLQVADALCCAHDQGVIHCDLKPHNIMITDTGGRRNALVLDFGISSILEERRGDDFRTLTDEGSMRGTPSYMSPEQLDGRQILPQTDIYAWGLVFLEVLTGRRIFEGGSFASIITQQMGNAPVPIPPALFDHPLGTILACSVEKSLETRYTNAQEILDVLQDCDISDLDRDALSTPFTATEHSERRLSLSASGPVRRTVDESQPSGPTLTEDPRPTSVLPVVLAAVVVLGLILAWVLISGDTSDPASQANAKPQPPPETSPGPTPDTTPPEPPPEPEAPPAPEPIALVRLAPLEAISTGHTPESARTLRQDPTISSDFTFYLSLETGLAKAQPTALPALQVMATEVSQKIWDQHAEVRQKPEFRDLCPGEPGSSTGEALQPVHHVGAAEAEAFCRALGMRLPTHREWEAIARGQEQRLLALLPTRPDDWEHQMRLLHDVGTLPWSATPEGVLDLSGNLREWVVCPPEDRTPLCFPGPNGTAYATRGGSYASEPLLWRTDIPGMHEDITEAGCHRALDIGFRCVE